MIQRKLKVTDNITVSSSTVSSSYTTGALIVTGGVGIGDNLYINKAVVPTVTTVSTATYTISSGSIFVYNYASGTITTTLPSLSTSVGITITIVSDSTYSVTISPTFGDSVDGILDKTITLSSRYGVIKLLAVPSSWVTI
jgi:molybdopterin biosynthesis enzyme